MMGPYSRRGSLEISGIPTTVKVDKLEDEIIEIFKVAKFTANWQNLKTSDIQAVHRVGGKGKVVMKVANRKFVRTALINHKTPKAQQFILMTFSSHRVWSS